MQRSIQWMMNAIERVKMSKEPKPRLRPLTTTQSKIHSSKKFSYFSSFFK